MNATTPTHPSILERIAAATRKRLTQERALIPDAELAAQAEAIAAQEQQDTGFNFPFEQALSKPGVSFICEVKKASPSKGVIAHDFPYLEIARDYEAAGASAISCLTEPFWFLGSNEHLQVIAQHVSIPLLRKDFTVDRRMIYEAKVLGAHAVLLICSLLDNNHLSSYLNLAHELGLSALVEAHDEREVERALQAGARIVGVNNRNLATFEVDTANSQRLRAQAGNNVLFVSESGITTRQDIANLEAIGVDAVLIGEALMRSNNRKALLTQLKTGSDPIAPALSTNAKNELQHAHRGNLAEAVEDKETARDASQHAHKGDLA